MTSSSLQPKMADPSTQLNQEFRADVAAAHASHRPILRRLNADSSWLLQLPRPAAAARRSHRTFYTILVDPWLSGGQSDVAKWFSQQWHAIEPALGSIAEVEELARESEVFAAAQRPKKGKKAKGQAEEWDDDRGDESFIDAVAVSHEFTDHCHKETLLQLPADVPVFANDVRGQTLP